jgi:hypothetical protein
MKVGDLRMLRPVKTFFWKIQRKVVKLLPMKYDQHNSKFYLFYGVPNTERILKKTKCKTSIDHHSCTER